MKRIVTIAAAVAAIAAPSAGAFVKPPPMPRCHPHDHPHIPCRIEPGDQQ